MDTKIEDDPLHELRLGLIGQARHLLAMAESDERRARWLERCQSHPSEAHWLRGRATRRREHAKQLAARFDGACRREAS